MWVFLSERHGIGQSTMAAAYRFAGSCSLLRGCALLTNYATSVYHVLSTMHINLKVVRLCISQMKKEIMHKGEPFRLPW